jgi:hypothetical protein
VRASGVAHWNGVFRLPRARRTKLALAKTLWLLPEEQVSYDLGPLNRRFLHVIHKSCCVGSDS